MEKSTFTFYTQKKNIKLENVWRFLCEFKCSKFSKKLQKRNCKQANLEFSCRQNLGIQYFYPTNNMIDNIMIDNSLIKTFLISFHILT